MTAEGQEDTFRMELHALWWRWQNESDLTLAQAIGVLEVFKAEMIAGAYNLGDDPDEDEDEAYEDEG